MTGVNFQLFPGAPWTGNRAASLAAIVVGTAIAVYSHVEFEVVGCTGSSGSGSGSCSGGAVGAAVLTAVAVPLFVQLNVVDPSSPTSLVAPT